MILLALLKLHIGSGKGQKLFSIGKFERKQTHRHKVCNLLCTTQPAAVTY